jgi:type II secretory pathway pseudopilin PulG
MNTLRLFFNAQLSTLNVQRSTLDTRRIMWSAVTNAVRHRFPVYPHKAASRGIPLAAALQNFSTFPKKPSCPLCLRVRQQQRHANLRTLELPHFRTSSPAFTLIELVAALSLFVVILGILMTVLNSATEMWSASRSQKKEQTAALAITDLIADDLYQAVADNSVPNNSTANAPEYPSFILETPPINATLNDVVVLLAFARRSSSRVPDPDTAGATDTRFSLDAVFYTYYLNALFRHVIPLYNDFNDPEPLGTLLHELLDSIRNAGTHDDIIEALQDPTKSSDVKWQYTLLAERVLPSLNATIPEGFVRKEDPGFPHMVEGSDKRPIGNNMKLHPIYGRLTTDVLPDQIDVALHLFDEQDWAKYELLRDQDTKDARYQIKTLGTHVSRRITLPQAGGSRLP